MPGAVDNLAASAIAVALARFLGEHPDEIPRDTELRFVSFGSEEAGTRGSRRYITRHRDELARLDARLLNLEMVADPRTRSSSRSRGSAAVEGRRRRPASEYPARG